VGVDGDVAAPAGGVAVGGVDVADEVGRESQAETISAAAPAIAAIEVRSVLNLLLIACPLLLSFSEGGSSHSI
jgi:hypothetical protein